jgi:hypothetical protein
MALSSDWSHQQIATTFFAHTAAEAQRYLTLSLATCV